MTAPEDPGAQELLASLSPDEQGAVVALWADQIQRGWIPKRADLEDALHAIRDRDR